MSNFKIQVVHAPMHPPYDVHAYMYEYFVVG